MNGLKPGRIVYLRQPEEEERPAIVTWVADDGQTINCTAFGPHGQINGHSGVPYVETLSGDDYGYSWHWMFEGQQTRYQPDRVEKEALTPPAVGKPTKRH